MLSGIRAWLAILRGELMMRGGRRRFRGAAEGREEGSVVLALLVVSILSVTATVLVQRNMSEAHATRLDERRAEALAAADLGVAEASARVEFGETADFSTSGSVDGADYAVVADYDGGNWIITSTGTSGSAERTVEATFEAASPGWQLVAWREIPS